ncbi:MAG TPA: hypothetical protein VE173_07910, partial [Longimicrobiales bacterium]|nr:hypothetical protein [Longimicrobiales bacterium]
RGRVVATVGEPLAVEPFRPLHDESPHQAVRALTGELTARLAALTLNTGAVADRRLVETAEAIYARAKGEGEARTRRSLGDRFERLQAFARGLAWLRAQDPEEVARLERAVGRYRRIGLLLGSTEADVPHRLRPARVLLHAVRALLPLVLLLPPALAATIAWAVPYHVPRLVVRMVRPELDSISSYKLGAAILAFPAMLALWVAAAWWLAGLAWAVVTAVILPLAGLAWIVWADRWVELREDALVVLRAAPRRRIRERLDAMRRDLVEAFDRVAASLPRTGPDEGGPRREAGADPAGPRRS